AMAIPQEGPRRLDFSALSGPLCGGAVLPGVPAWRRRSRLRVPPSSVDVAVHRHFGAGSGGWSGVTLLVRPPEGAANCDRSARREAGARLTARGGRAGKLEVGRRENEQQRGL